MKEKILENAMNENFVYIKLLRVCYFTFARVIHKTFKFEAKHLFLSSRLARIDLIAFVFLWIQCHGQ